MDEVSYARMIIAGQSTEATYRSRQLSVTMVTPKAKVWFNFLTLDDDGKIPANVEDTINIFDEMLATFKFLPVSMRVKLSSGVGSASWAPAVVGTPDAQLIEQFNKKYTSTLLRAYNSLPVILYNNIFYFAGNDNFDHLYVVDRGYALNSNNPPNATMIAKVSGPIIMIGVANGLVYYGAAGKETSSQPSLHAFDPKTLKERWTLLTESGVFHYPLTNNGNIYFGDNGGILYAVKEDDAQLIWVFKIADGSVTSVPIFNNGIVYVGTEGGHIYGVNTENRKIEKDIKTSYAWIESLSYADGKIYFDGWISDRDGSEKAVVDFVTGVVSKVK